MSKAHWKITGYVDQEVVFERSIWGPLSDRQIEQMLRRLACRHLSDDQIVSASLRKNARGRTAHLDVHRMKDRRGFIVGHRGRYTARYEEALPKPPKAKSLNHKAHQGHEVRHEG